MGFMITAAGPSAARMETAGPNELRRRASIAAYPNVGILLFVGSYDSGLGNSASCLVTGSRFNIRGRSTVDATTPISGESLSLAATTNWTDYSFMTWVNLSNLSGGGGIVGRATDATHYYLLELKRDSSGRPAWFLESRDGATWKMLATGSISYSAGSWLRLKLTMRGTSLLAEASTDGNSFTTLGSAIDSRYTVGESDCERSTPCGLL